MERCQPNANLLSVCDSLRLQTGLPDNPELRMLTLCTADIEHELMRGQEVPFVNALMHDLLQNTSSRLEEDRPEVCSLQLQVLDLYRQSVLAGQNTRDFIKGDTTKLTFGVLGIVSYTVAWYCPYGKLGTGAVARNVAVQALSSIEAEFTSTKESSTSS